MTAGTKVAPPGPGPAPDALPPDLVAAYQAGRFAEAERLALAFLAAAPTHALGLNVLGVLRLSSGRAAEAHAPLARSVALAPQAAPPALNLALVAHAAGDRVRALAWARRAHRLDPSLPDAHATEASAARAAGDRTQAEAALRRALALVPAVPEFLANAGNLQMDADAFDAAAHLFRRALAVTPAMGSPRFQLACLGLLRGDLAAGWRDYDARFEPPAMATRRPFPQPAWQGTPLPSSRLLVWSEQGLAEEIVFASLLPDLLKRTPNVVLECDPRLVAAFARRFPALAIRPRRNPPDPALLSSEISHQVALGSLPRLFRPDLASFDPRIAVFQPDAARAAASRAWLESLGPGPKVGIAWRSIRDDAEARRLHTSLAEWGPILATPGVAFVCLQYGDFEREIGTAEAMFGLPIHRMPGLDLFNDLEGTIALSAGLDLAISTITTAHAFPAAAGIETWLLHPAGDYFALGRAAYPWYPRTRCFTRPRGGDWRQPIDAVAQALRERA